MNIEIQGRIQEIGQITQLSDKFSKLVVIVETGEQYPQTLDIELHKGKTEFIDTYKVGDEVIFECDLRGRRWQGGDKDIIFKTLVSWKQHHVGSVETKALRNTADSMFDALDKMESATQTGFANAAPTDDLPF